MPYFKCIVLLKAILKEGGWGGDLFFLLTGFSNSKKKKIHVKPSGSSGRTNASLTQHWLSKAANRNQCQSQGTFRNSTNWSVSFLSVNSEPWWLMTKLVWGAGRGCDRKIQRYFTSLLFSHIQNCNWHLSWWVCVASYSFHFLITSI